MFRTFIPAASPQLRTLASAAASASAFVGLLSLTASAQCNLSIFLVEATIPAERDDRTSPWSVPLNALVACFIDTVAMVPRIFLVSGSSSSGSRRTSLSIRLRSHRTGSTHHRIAPVRQSAPRRAASCAGLDVHRGDAAMVCFESDLFRCHRYHECVRTLRAPNPIFGLGEAGNYSVLVSTVET